MTAAGWTVERWVEPLDALVSRDSKYQRENGYYLWITDTSVSIERRDISLIPEGCIPLHRLGFRTDFLIGRVKMANSLLKMNVYTCTYSAYTYCIYRVELRGKTRAFIRAVFQNLLLILKVYTRDINYRFSVVTVNFGTQYLDSLHFASFTRRRVTVEFTF